MTLMLQISPPPSTEISAQTMMDTGLHRWLWLIWYRLKRHSASRINLLIFGVGILIGLMQQFGHGHPDRMFPFLLAIFLCGMPSGLFYNLVIEISNIPAARLWPERMKGTWSLYVLAGVLTISIYMLLAWGSLPGVELFLVGTLFYASGLYPASLIAIYFALIGVTWKMPQILTTHVLAASLTLVASGMAVAAMGVLRIRRRWLGDHRVQWLPGMDKKRPGSRSAQRNRPGWKSGAFKTDAQSVARVLRFESRLVSRWAMHWMITAAALFTCIVVFILGVQYSTNHQHMDEAVMVTALLLGFMLTATFISSEIAVRVPDKRWLPISRKLYARGIWVAHLQSLLQFSVLLAVLASACVLAVMRLLDVSHAPSWLNCTFASLIVCTLSLALQQDFALRHLGSMLTTTMNDPHWRASLWGSIRRIIAMLANMAMLLAGATAALVSEWHVGLFLTLAVLVTTESLLLVRIRRHFARNDMLMQ